MIRVMIKTLLLILNAAKLGPLVKTGGTMLISVVAYAFVFGPWYAVGVVALLFAHEMGHFVSARRLGLDVGAPTFIPFVGAWVELKDAPLSVAQEARIAFAGPFVGTAAALAVLFAGLGADSRLLIAIAYAGLVLNLFNLVPVTPFDGGRIVAILSPKIWLLGAPILVGIFLWIPSPMFLLVLVLLAPTVWRGIKAAWRGEVPEDNPRYYEASRADRLRYAGNYLLLLAFLCIMTYQVHKMLQGGAG
jgi:Zn-dependent protease